MKRALFVVSTRGLGHVTRCRALASEMTSLGWRCTLTSKSPMSASSVDVSILDLGEPPHDVMEALGAAPIVAVVDEPTETGVPDLIVCGSAGLDGDPVLWGFDGGTDVLAGPQYALLRPQFRELRSWRSTCVEPYVDTRAIHDMTASEVGMMMRDAEEVMTHGGMRAMEAACVRGNAIGLRIEPRNAGEALNALGLLRRRDADLVDGLGCKRVADEINGRFS